MGGWLRGAGRIGRSSGEMESLVISVKSRRHPPYPSITAHRSSKTYTQWAFNIRLNWFLFYNVCVFPVAQDLRARMVCLRWWKPTWTRRWSWMSSSLTKWPWPRSTTPLNWWSTVNGMFIYFFDFSWFTSRLYWVSVLFLLHSIRTIVRVSP